jgi:DNA (cytosine-5)-methyltransferase 1
LGYTCEAAILPACSVGFDHARARIFFVGHTNGKGKSIVPLNAEVAWMPRHHNLTGGMVPADGISARLAKLRAFGNAIVPQVAAEFVRAFIDG